MVFGSVGWRLSYREHSNFVDDGLQETGIALSVWQMGQMGSTFAGLLPKSCPIVLRGAPVEGRPGI
jgi:hypothetical protein